MNEYIVLGGFGLIYLAWFLTWLFDKFSPIFPVSKRKGPSAPKRPQR